MKKLAKVCPNCKTVNVDNASFCQKCGKELSQTSKEPQRVQYPKSEGNIQPESNNPVTPAKPKVNKVMVGMSLLMMLFVSCIFAIIGSLFFIFVGAFLNTPTSWSIYFAFAGLIVGFSMIWIWAVIIAKWG